MMPYPVAYRIAAILFCCLLGMVFPLALVLAAFLAWAVYTDLFVTAPASSSIVVNRWTVSKDDVNWKSHFLASCGSPAESTFLDAVINDFGLVPAEGHLTASNLKFSMQERIGNYRVDFLANNWLVIEIDGATYHSSPEAVANDKIRDRYLRDNGYDVLRIPAKIVFTDPKNAIINVRSAMESGPTTSKNSGDDKPRWSFAQAFSSANNFISDVSETITVAAAVQKALEPQEAAFFSQKLVINHALETAELKINAEKFRSQSEFHARHYDESYHKLKKVLEKEFPKSTTELSRTEIFTITEMMDPHPHSDPKSEIAIKVRYADLLAKRSQYFAGVRQRLATEAQMSKLVQSELIELGCPQCWDFIAETGQSLNGIGDPKGFPRISGTL